MNRIVSAILLLLALMSANAQGIDPRFFNNQFLAVGGGVTLYNHDTGLGTGYNAELSYGNWILKDMALRFSLGTTSAQNALDLTSDFYYSHVNFMWDAISTLSGSNDVSRVVSVYPMIGFGVLYRPDIPIPGGTALEDLKGYMLTDDSSCYRYDADFLAMIGAHVEFRIPTPAMNKFPLFLEAKMFVLPQDYDFNHKMAQLYNITFGIKADLNYDPHHKSIPGESRSWSHDWFVGLAAGPNYSVMKMDNDKISFGNRMGYNADITFGRNFSSLWTVRFGFSIMSGTTEHHVREGFDPEPYDYTFYNMRADLMFNVANISGPRSSRHFGILPYAGTGLIHRFDRDIVVMEADAGVLAKFYVSKHLDIYADARYIMVPPRFNEGKSGKDQLTNGYPLLNFGIIYNFDPTSSRYAKSSFRLRD